MCVGFGWLFIGLVGCLCLLGFDGFFEVDVSGFDWLGLRLLVLGLAIC